MKRIQSVRKTTIVPDAVLKNIQTQGKPGIFYSGFMGEVMKRTFKWVSKTTS